MQLVSHDPREVREFLAAKKSKREPLRFEGHGQAAADFVPRSAANFANFRQRLIGATDWGHASERIEQLEHELIRRHGHGLPVPRKVIQNSNRSISLMFRDGLAVCHADGVVTVIGKGNEARRTVGITPEFLGLLHMQTRLQ